MFVFIVSFGVSIFITGMGVVGSLVAPSTLLSLWEELKKTHNHTETDNSTTQAPESNSEPQTTPLLQLLFWNQIFPCIKLADGQNTFMDLIPSLVCKTGSNT